MPEGPGRITFAGTDEAETMGWQGYFKMMVGLVVIVNPLLAVPVFVSLTEGATPADQLRVARTAAVAVTVILTLAALAGQSLLAFFSISISSFRVGGGILILLMAIAMMNARLSGFRHTPEEAEEAMTKENVAVVPLAIPLMAGPGAISTVIIYAQQGGTLHHVILIGEVVALAVLLWLTLRAAERIGRALGRTGLNIATRLMGLVLAAIAVEFITGGLRTLLPGLG